MQINMRILIYNMYFLQKNQLISIHDNSRQIRAKKLRKVTGMPVFTYNFHWQVGSWRIIDFARRHNISLATFTKHTFVSALSVLVATKTGAANPYLARRVGCESQFSSFLMA
jgi:hypothetical protein